MAGLKTNCYLWLRNPETLKRHQDRILTLIRSRITNGVVEGHQQDQGCPQAGLRLQDFQELPNDHLPCGWEAGATYTMLNMTKHHLVNLYLKKMRLIGVLMLMSRRA